MSKIYTKKGDKGETSLLGGNKVPKYHPRVEAYGTIDELNSFIGLLRCHIVEQRTTNNEKMILQDIQKHLYLIGSLVACDSCKEQNQLPQITIGDIELLEKEIDNMTSQLPELTAFIIPGGNVATSYCHVARTVCRRAERRVIQLSEKTKIDDMIIVYLNRLSDYLFTLARKITKDAGLEDLKYK